MANKRKSDRIDRKDRCRKLFDAGMTRKEIAETLHLSKDQVSRSLKGYKKNGEKRNVTPAPYARGYRYGAGLV